MRRMIGALAVVGVVLSGCGSGDDTGSGGSVTSPTKTAPAADSTVPVTTPSRNAPAATDAPTTTAADDVPVSEQRIVALDETAALNMLTLGIEPAVTLTTLSSELFVPIADSLGLETLEFSVAEPSLEVLASLKPDRIVTLGNPFVVSRVADYEAIAPVVVIPVDGTWQEQVTALGDALDRSDQAAALVEAVEAEIAAGAVELAASGAEGTSVSILTARGAIMMAATGDGPAGTVLADLGLSRPAGQSSAGSGLPFVPLSAEMLTAHDADVLILPESALFGADSVRSAPLFATLSAVANGAAYDAAAEPWIVGGSAFATWWVLRDIEAVLIDHAAPATSADAVARWDEFVALTG